MKSKKILIVVIIMIAILAIGGGVFAYLYIATDTFKSDKELFSKYISQNLETFQKLGNSQTVKTYKELENQEKYESNTNIKATYSEGGEVSNPINNLAAKLDIQKDFGEKYMYIDGQILFNEEEYLESEIIKDSDLYGIRFSDVAKQFVSIKDDSNLEKVASGIGTDTATLQKIIDIVDGEKQITEEIATKDEMKTLKDKYTNMIVETIANGTFSSNKKGMITYNNNTIKANSYTVSITNEQVENLIIQILNSIKTETIITKNLKDENVEKFEDQIDETIKSISDEKEIPAIKITVYEQNKNTIRTVIEAGLDKLILENSEEDGKIKSNIQISRIVSEKTNEYNIELTKMTTEKQENLNIIANISEGEQEYTLGFDVETNITAANIILKATASYKKDILTAALKIENTVDLQSNFDKKVSLENTNNITLNDIEDEKRNNIIKALKENVPLKVQKRIGLLKDALGINNNTQSDEEVPEYELSKTEINAFNAKFEFYTGDEVSAENVKSLLDTVKNNLGSYEITLADGQDDTTQTNPDRLRYDIKLNIERNKTNEDGIKKILEKIKENEKYNVSISYKDENQLIDYIMIEEVEN